MRYGLRDIPPTWKAKILSGMFHGGHGGVITFDQGPRPGEDNFAFLTNEEIEVKDPCIHHEGHMEPRDRLNPKVCRIRERNGSYTEKMLFIFAR